MAQLIIPKEQESTDFFYFAEQTSPDAEDVKSFDFSTKKAGSTWWLEFNACVHLFETMNRNVRQYLGDNIMEMIFSDKNKSLMAHNGWYGEMDHPAPNKEGEKLTSERVQRIELSRRSHKIMQPRVESNLLNARIQTSSGTECGRGMAADIVQGLIPRFSCRAIAKMEYRNGKPTVIVKKLITYDWVLYPSHKEAGMTGTFTPKTINIRESADDKQFYYMNMLDPKNVDACIAIKELMSYAGQHDPNTAMICEAFDLNESDIIGVTKDYKQSIILDGANTIYANMDPRIVQKVKNSLTDLF